MCADREKKEVHYSASKRRRHLANSDDGFSVAIGQQEL